MVARGPYYVDKDAWVARLVGGTVDYGNGAGTLIHVGPVTNAVPGQPDFKSRGMFEISAADMTAFLLDASSVDDATITLTVGLNTCIGSRGGQIRLFLEEMTADFSERSESGCDLGSGSGAGVWSRSDSATTLNRAFYSGSPGLGDAMDFDVQDLMTGRLAAKNYSAFRFRIIEANLAGTNYDETRSSGVISICSREDGTAGNRPKLNGHVTAGGTPKAFSDTATFTDAFDVSQSGTSPSFADSMTATDTFTAGPTPVWSTSEDADGNGRALLYMPSANSSWARLTSVSVQDVVLRAKCQLDKMPAGGKASFMLLERVVNLNSCYRARMSMGGSNHDITIQLEKVVGGTTTVLQYIQGLRPFLVDTYWWLMMQVEGVSPTVINAKVWHEGENEPGWQLQVEDSEATLQSALALGMGANGPANLTNFPLTFQIDQFEAYAP